MVDANDASTDGLVVTCAICGGEFRRSAKTKGPPRIYCGDACRLTARRRDGRKSYAKNGRNMHRHRRDCALCGAEFATGNSRTITCGSACGKALSDWSRSAAALASRSRRCEKCGQAFVMASPSGKAARGEVNEGRFCSNACKADAVRVHASKAEAKRAAGARRSARLTVALEGGGPCVVCGGEIPGTRPRKTCSDKCTAERRRRRAQEQSIAADEKDRSPRSCRCCGATFAPEYGDRRRIYCSAKCMKRAADRPDHGKNHRKRARHFKVTYEPVNRLKVFERDGWRCQVCGRKTPKRLMGTCDPRAPELDHRIPMAKGGGHTWSNVQCACRACNAAKGATMVKGQMPLFANPTEAGF